MKVIIVGPTPTCIMKMITRVDLVLQAQLFNKSIPQISDSDKSEKHMNKDKHVYFLSLELYLQ